MHSNGYLVRYLVQVLVLPQVIVSSFFRYVCRRVMCYVPGTLVPVSYLFVREHPMFID
jgi:hypothetical protein